MADVDVPAVVSTSWLNEQLNSGQHSIRVLDVTWYSDKDAYEEYAEKHIPTASHFDIMFGVTQTDIFPRNLPDSNTFQTNARGKAVRKDSHVVVYESTGKCGYFLGSRAWWMFKLFGHSKVSVLDGGLEKWIADGFETTNAQYKMQEGDFETNVGEGWLRKFDSMTKNLESSSFQVADSRPADSYKGKADDETTGHYPGAASLPFSTILDQETKTLKTVEELKSKFKEAGLDLEKPVVTHCNSGMSSCSLALAAYMCGAKDVAVYHGGWTEWKNRSQGNQRERDV